MPGYDPNTREQIIKLKDGRTAFKTHNGFRYYIEDVKGVVTQVTEEYFLKAIRNRIKLPRKK